MCHVLDVRHQEADLARFELLDLHRLRREDSQLIYIEDLAVGPETDLHTFAQRARNNTGQHDYTAIRIEPRIEDESLQRGIRRTSRRPQALHNAFEDLVHGFPS